MNARALAAAALGLVLATGCTPMANSPRGPRPAEQTRAAIRDRGPVPDASRMLADIQLVTFPYRRGDVVGRDTVLGVAPVESWLQRVAERTAGSGTPFRLETEEILLCGGAAVERGWFPLGGDQADQPYLALWQPARGQWRLAQLWLAPDASMGPRDLAAGCGASEFMQHLSFGVAAGGGDGTGLDAVADSLRGVGYDKQSLTGETTARVRVWGRYRLSPQAFLRLNYDYRFPTKLAVEDTAAVNLKRIDLTAKEYTFSLTGEVRLGPVWLEAGPAVRTVSLDYADVIEIGSSVFREDAAESLTQFGAVARASYRYTVWQQMNVLGSIGYDFFPDAQPETTVAPAVGVGNLSIMLGLEWEP